MEPSLKIEDLLSFKESDRLIPINAVTEEFRLMKNCLKKPLTEEIAVRVCEKSGSHLLKMVNPRIDKDHACLYFEVPGANQRPKILPAVNAADIPFCKVLYRPLNIDVDDRPGRSVIDDIMNPDESSEAILSAFAMVFGQKVLDAARATLLHKPKRVTKLAAGEFPIIFIPRADGSDLQITPVSPAAAYMGIKSTINALYERKQAQGLSGPYGSFGKQTISSKLQNISGAIGGPRRRVTATMPPVMEQAEAEMYRFAHSGSFPRWRDADVADWVLRYADMLEADTIYNDRNTRGALDKTADRLLSDAQDFIDETLAEVGYAAEYLGLKRSDIPTPPNPADVLIRRRWQKDNYNKARKALTSAHFQHRMARHLKARETVST
ncbi:MAG: hypothetical protein OXC68_09510 [Aestuariivita sp.]|nr:hypothetical protein [Aestuariivita sp.]